MPTISEFLEHDIRVGTVLTAEALPNARVPAWVMTIDFGAEIGIKKSSARITKLYEISDLIGRQVLAVVSFPPRQIGKITSECLVLGLPSDDQPDTEVVLIQPERKVENGTRLL